MPMMTEDGSSAPVPTDGSLQEVNPPASAEPQADAPATSSEGSAEREEDTDAEESEQLEVGANDASPCEVDQALGTPPSSAATAATNRTQEEDPRLEVEKQPYTFEKCTVQIAVQFLPEDGDAKGRPVLLGVRTHQDAPIVRVLRLSELGDLPPPINALVEQLKSELPAREQATKERMEKEKLESLQRRLATAKPPRHSKPATPEKPKTLQAATPPARTVLTAHQRANAVNQAADEKQQLAMF